MSGLEYFAWALNALALAFGVALGARGFLDPKWAARLVRLQPDGRGGGFAEFRATYGGVFLGIHLVALAFTLLWVWHGAIQGGMWAAGAAAVLSAGWFGACAGRVLSMLRDGTRTRFNQISSLVEFAMGALIAAPWLVWAIAPPA